MGPAHVTEREFAAVCPLGHRSYLRLYYMPGGRPLTRPCRKCDRPARLVELPPVPCRHTEEVDVSRRGERSATLAARFGRDAPQ